ncbi:radical SAM protein [Enterococcus gilvus]|jgi:DNA repair photolyase|uniref:SPL family radical SAM protein n=1 Tax=Enterococcus gilvus TaxID=160453 RepID=UPI000DF5D6C8|nr:radical SAM protein [Enterococcus gilvus]AXG38437.1 radical SAM protein [Enterococcus gilvus]MDU5510688.1 radical SAM protein [Enterococcus gilvus]
MHYKEYKSILSAKNGLNLFRGCTHGCIYCDSRSDCYQINHPFEDIEVKAHALEILEQELQRRRKPCMIGTGAMTDPYIQLEPRLNITRGALELIDTYEFGVAIQTKSNRILRDLDLLSSINKKTKAVVEMTLTTYDETVCKILEPYVSTTKERFETLMAFKEVGVPTVVWLSPILPFINDTEENLRGLLDYCIQAGVKGILCFGFGVTMRAGNRDYFYQQLDKHFPGMKKKYQYAFGDSYVCNSPNHEQLMKLFIETCEKHAILWRTDDVFQYLHEFEDKREQLSLF